MAKHSTRSDSPDRGRSSAGRKAEAILRLLRDDVLDVLPLEPGVTAATSSRAPVVAQWRDGGSQEPSG